eukprot:6075320-Pyramimonas_sp.AAC.1
MRIGSSATASDSAALRARATTRHAMDAVRFFQGAAFRLSADGLPVHQTRPAPPDGAGARTSADSSSSGVQSLVQQ